jgi:predicted nucleotidyltransferase component of viral defense system
MISRAHIDERVREWGLREDIVEKDYVLGWVLWGIGADPTLGMHWVFKGGTCLKKCYIETYRFSEDLDFTVLPGGPIAPDDALSAIQRVLARVAEESGINFTVMPPKFRPRADGRAAEGRVYYQGPRNAPTPASIKLDLSAIEQVVRPTVLRPISHVHGDSLPEPAHVRCYGFEELFAEKIRAMGERSRPRDLYDIVNLYRRADLRLHPDLIRSVLIEKCTAKGLPVTTFAALEASAFRVELQSEWANMLEHQLPALPPYQDFWDELPNLFAWLEGTAMPEAPAALPAEAGEEAGWSPPPTVWTWGAGVPLETVRFAAANHLCVELGYQNSTRLIEPYSLRRTRDGHLLLHAVKTESREHRSYRVDQIQSLKVTTKPFKPEWAIEFSPVGAIFAPPTTRAPAIRTRMPRRSRRAARGGVTYIIECTRCGKRFYRSTRNTTLRKHKSSDGYHCSGTSGYFVGTR